MQDAKGRMVGYVAAGLLALLTIFTFGTLHDYGPESTIRRLREAIRNNDADALQQVVVQPIRSAPVQAILQSPVGRMIALGMNPKVVRTDRSPGQVIAAEWFPQPDGTGFYFVWVVAKDRSFWRVDAAATLRANSGAAG